MAGIAMTPLSGGDQFQFGTPLDNDQVDPSLATLQELVDRFAGEGVAKLRNLTWSTIWRPNVRLAERFRVGRVFIAGDAAHVHPPTGGRASTPAGLGRWASEDLRRGGLPCSDASRYVTGAVLPVDGGWLSR